MSIARVEAYRTADGACFGTAEEAYAQEIKGLCDRFPDRTEWLKKLVSSQWPASKKEFRTLVQLVRGWLAAAEGSLEQMSGGADGKKKE